MQGCDLFFSFLGGAKTGTFLKKLLADDFARNGFKVCIKYLICCSGAYFHVFSAQTVVPDYLNGDPVSLTRDAVRAFLRGRWRLDAMLICNRGLILLYGVGAMGPRRLVLRLTRLLKR